VAEVARGPLGRTLVLGAGAGRLAYDLHRALGATETVLLDLDPVLFTFATPSCAGRTLRLTEPSLPVFEASAVARTWELRAPAGLGRWLPFPARRRLAPPFAPASFDTVVTPWFIDQVPPDLRDLLGARPRAPAGRALDQPWPAHLSGRGPAAPRFTREEILELAARAGFQLVRWRTATLPHLVSPLNGRGRAEWALTFAATLASPTRERLAAAPAPAVPTFAGQSLFWHENPLLQAVVASVDGRRSIDEIARKLAPEVRAMGLDDGDLKEAVRQCLAAFTRPCVCAEAARGLGHRHVLLERRGGHDLADRVERESRRRVLNRTHDLPMSSFLPAALKPARSLAVSSGLP
jgi:hypothetical protein